LERQEDAAGRPLVRRQCEQVLSLERGGPCGDLIAVTAGEHVGQGRLAGPVRTHQRVHLAGGNLEGETLQDLLAVDGRVQIGDRQHQRVSSTRNWAITESASSTLSTVCCLRGAAVV